MQLTIRRRLRAKLPLTAEKHARIAAVVAAAYEELCEGGPERRHWLPHQERINAMNTAEPPYKT